MWGRLAMGSVGARCRGAGPAEISAGGVLMRRLAAGVAVLALSACAAMEQRTALPAPVEAPPPAEPVAVAPPPIPQGPVAVAALLPLSGRLAAVGAELQAGLMSMPTRPDVRLVISDTGGTVAGAQAAMGAAIANGAVAVIGPLLRDNAQAVRAAAAQAGMPVLALTNTASVAGETVAVLGHAPAQQVDQVLHAAAEEGRTRVAVIAPDSAYSRLALTAAQQTSGVSVVSQTLYPPGTDYNALSGIVRGAMASSADAVLLPTGGLDLIGLSSWVAHHGGGLRGARMLGTDLWESAPRFEREVSLRNGWFTSTLPAQVNAPPVMAETADDMAASGGPQMEVAASSEADGPGGPDPETAAGGAGTEGGAGDTAAASDEVETPPEVRTPAMPTSLQALVMDAHALVRAWSQDRSAPLQTWLHRPGGFSGASGLFRIGENGTVERFYNVLQLGAQGLVEVKTAPPAFPDTAEMPVRLERNSILPEALGPSPDDEEEMLEETPPGAPAT